MTHFHQNLLNELEINGWFLVDSFLSQKECHELRSLFKDKLDRGELKEAAIGRSSGKDINHSIRKSHTCWIDDWSEHKTLQKIEKSYFEMMSVINRHFYLGMKRLESQFAFYEKGGFYKKHLDQHKDAKNRELSLVLYLNDVTDGGEIILYNKNDRNKADLVYAPKEGAMIIFLSSQIFHEVKPTNQDRYGLTTWFRKDETFTL